MRSIKIFLYFGFMNVMGIMGMLDEGDPNGYIVFCPCMGRFGNQADHYLGALGFAKGLNRTLILPPWVEYHTSSTKSIQVPFKKYFDVDQLTEFHRVIPMEIFMKQLAPSIWPPNRRISFCYVSRVGDPNNAPSCDAKNGNPFGPFWDTFDIEFINSEIYGQYALNYDVYYGGNMPAKWNKKYPPDKWPVLAFTGAPASFPIQKENIPIHKYLKWNKFMDLEGDQWIRDNIPPAPFIGIHLRNGRDWERACELIPSTPLLFAAAQCLGYQNEHGEATQELCLPSIDVIVKKLKKAVVNFKAKSIFIATDNDNMISTLKKKFSKSNLTFVTNLVQEPHLDLVILSKSNYFIGNCISSFSAFVKRERDVLGFPSGFWGFPIRNKKKVNIEL